MLKVRNVKGFFKFKEKLFDILKYSRIIIVL
jgi:hypothetical protein